MEITSRPSNNDADAGLHFTNLALIESQHRRSESAGHKAAALWLGAGPFAMGEHFTGADILLTTCLTGALHRDIPLPDLLGGYLSRTTKRPAYERAMEANRPPAQ